jgi:hypothetical protein
MFQLLVGLLDGPGRREAAGLGYGSGKFVTALPAPRYPLLTLLVMKRL